MHTKDKGSSYTYNQATSSSSLDETDPLLWHNDPDNKKGKSKASPWHVLVPLFFLTFGMAALLTPMVQYYTEIFCTRYYQSKANDILFWVVGGGQDSTLPDVEDCAIPEVQAIVSKIQAILLFIDSACTFLTASYYGSMSDRYGRRLVFRIFSIGGILTMLCYIAVAKFQDLIGVTLLLLTPLTHGLLAGDVVTVAAIQAYISDCTNPETRTVAFGRMVASILAGSIIGPTVASILILKTGSVVCVFYLAIVIYCGLYIYATWFMPESLDEQAMEKARHQQQPSFWQKINLFSALSILTQAKPRQISQYAVPLLSAIQFFMATLAQPPIMLYAMLKFKWTAYEGGLLASMMSFVRFAVIIFVLPYILKMLQAYWKRKSTGNNEEVEKPYNQILFDTIMIRSGLGIQMIGLLIVASVTTENGFTTALAFESLSVLAQPSTRSLYTSLVDPSQVGALCGAQAVVESIATMIALVGINFIYSASVNTMPSLFIYVCAGISGTAFLLSFLIHPVKDQPHSPPA